MIIQCQSCNTKFRVGDDKVKPPGIKVRCSKCGEVFFYEYSIDGSNGKTEPSNLDQPSVNENSSVSEMAAEPELDHAIGEKIEEPETPSETPDQTIGENEQEPETPSETPDQTIGENEQEPGQPTEAPDQAVGENVQEPESPTEAPLHNEVADNQVSEPAHAEDDNTETSTNEFSSAEVESIEKKPESSKEEDDLSRLSKEIMAAQIGTNITQDVEASSEDNPSYDAQIDKLDDLPPETVSQDEAIKEFIEDQHPQDSVQEPAYTPPPESPRDPENNIGREFRSSNLVVDQNVLEQTYTKGTVASSSAADAYHIKSSSTARGYRNRRRSNRGGFFISFFKFIFTVVLLVALFVSSMYVLNETKIFPNDFYTKFSSVTGNMLGEGRNVDLKRVRVVDENGKWFNSKYGLVYVVSGEIINRSNESINYVKLNINYISDGNRIFSQDVYAGNTISDWEIRNKPFNKIQTKLLRIKGDISYEDVNNLDGLNFDIQPGEEVPFFSIFPAQDKILGLKYRVEVMDYESSKVSKKP